MSLWDKVMGFIGFVEEEVGEEPQMKLTAWEERESRISVSSGSKKVVQIWTPQNGADAKEMANALKKGWLVIMDLSLLDRDDAKQVLHFIYGVIFALRGSMKPLGDSIFLLAPPGYEVFEQPFPKGGVKLGEVDSSGHPEQGV
ncbi:MAG: cell division protein SepF [Synergistetes bacterium]|nr:MAG: cell division protein sepF [bacterium 42_11]MBC7332204.1 cell division protein SepF [Synergistota bacterium]MDK2871224.1 cell division inhibitor SepF [bacterium]